MLSRYDGVARSADVEIWAVEAFLGAVRNLLPYNICGTHKTVPTDRRGTKVASGIVNYNIVGKGSRFRNWSRGRGVLHEYFVCGWFGRFWRVLAREDRVLPYKPWFFNSKEGMRS